MIGGKNQYVGPFASDTVEKAVQTQTIGSTTTITEDSLSFLTVTIATGIVVTVNTGITWRIQGFLPTSFY